MPFFAHIKSMQTMAHIVIRFGVVRGVAEQYANEWKSEINKCRGTQNEQRGAKSGSGLHSCR